MSACSLASQCRPSYSKRICTISVKRQSVAWLRVQNKTRIKIINKIRWNRRVRPIARLGQLQCAYECWLSCWCIVYTGEVHRCRTSVIYFKTRKVAISAALPLEAAHTNSRSRLQSQSHNTPAYQISAKSGNTCLSYWQVNKLSGPVYQRRIKLLFSQRWVYWDVPNLGRTSPLYEFVVDVRY